MNRETENLKKEGMIEEMIDEMIEEMIEEMIDEMIEGTIEEMMTGETIIIQIKDMIIIEIVIMGMVIRQIKDHRHQILRDQINHTEIRKVFHQII